MNNVAISLIYGIRYLAENKFAKRKNMNDHWNVTFTEDFEFYFTYIVCLYDKLLLRRILNENILLAILVA